MSYIEYKSNGHPDTLCDILSDVAIESFEEFCRTEGVHMYASFDNSYLKGGKFPHFKVGGYMSFDFKKFDKEFRYEMFRWIKTDVIEAFKKIFPIPSLQVDFDLNLEPSNLSQIAEQKRYTASSTLYQPFEFNPIERELVSFVEYLNQLEYVGSERKIQILPDEIVINQTFLESDQKVFHQFIEDTKIFLGSSPLISKRIVVLNPETYTKATFNGTYWCRFGSSVFHNGSGSVGRSNRHYGFTNYNRPLSKPIYGKHSTHPLKYFFNNIEKIISENDLKNEVSLPQLNGVFLSAQIGQEIGRYEYTIK